MKSQKKTFVCSTNKSATGKNFVCTPVEQKILVEGSCSGSYDYLIVGDGSAGCIVARKMSDKVTTGGKCKWPKVCILERGSNQIQQFGYPTNPLILETNILTQTNAIIDPNSTYNQLVYGPKYAVNYVASINATTSDPILSSRQPVLYSSGNGWGGGGSHFFMAAFRGTPDVWNNYATLNGDSSWNYNSLLPTFMAIETYTPNVGGCLDTSQRGQNGPINYTQMTAASYIDPSSVTVDPLVLAFATAPNVGFGYTCDYNSGTEPYVGVISVQEYQTLPIDPSTGNGQWRSWSHNAFIPIGTIINTNGESIGKRNLEIRSNAHADIILFSGTKAIGVRYIDLITGNPITVYANQIILSAGTMETPQILQRSGVGDPTLLASLGISVLVNNPNVGSNMEGQAGPSAVLGTAMNIRPFFAVITDLHDDSLPPSDPFYYPADGVRRVDAPIISSNLIGFPGASVCLFADIYQTHYGGTVQITSVNPLVPPNINLNLFADDTTGLVNGSSLNKCVKALYNLQVVAAAAGTIIVPIPGLSPDPTDFVTPTDLANYVKSVSTFADHQTGTCRMGTSIANGVVDSNQNVFGLQNLKIADLSIYPYTMDGNPMTSALIAGLKCVQSFGISLNPIL